MSRVAFVAACAACLVLSASAGEKKYIAIGWEFGAVPLDGILRHADELDRTAIDGIGIYVNARRADGTAMSTRGLMHEPAWSREDLAPFAAKLRALTAHRSCRESFISSYHAPSERRIGWTDDAEWARIAHNMRTVAWLAKTGGCVGLIMDPEDYKRKRQYVRADGEPPYDELARIARRRGREVFGAVFGEFPEAKILSFWLLTMGKQYASGYNLAAAMRNGGDLWPHFVDGIFDALPPTATLIDGNENAYRFEWDRDHFARSSCATRENLQGLLSPENRAKYRAQLQISFGLYMDMYTNPEGSGYYFGPVDGSRLTHFERNLAAATETASEYVWLWSEKHGFVHWDEGEQSNRRIQCADWNTMLPGLTDMMRATKDPFGGIAKWEDDFAAGRIAPVNDNVACDGTDASKVPAPYEPWQESAKYCPQQGTFGWDGAVGETGGGSLCAEGVAKGCFTLYVKNRRPGERLGIRFSVRGRPTVASVHFLRGGAWDWKFPAVAIPAEGEGEWMHGRGSVRIPLGADGFGIQLGAGGMKPGERVWYDNIAVYSIEFKGGE